MKTNSLFLKVSSALALAAWLGLSAQALADGSDTDTSTKEATNVISSVIVD